MTNDEAQAEAVRRWSPTAYATEHPEPDHFFSVGNDVTPKGWNPKHGRLKHRHGWGSSWEAAFALADQRQELLTVEQ
jgi:hypothetical protein